MGVQRKYRVGRSCQSWCTKCKMILEHTIIAMVKDLPKRVQCSTCGSQHNFRLRSAQSPRTKKAARSGTRKKGRGANWETLVTGTDNAARDYRMTETFQSEEILQHGSFGKGIVREVLPGDKIEVLFEAGVKILVHGRE